MGRLIIICVALLSCCVLTQAKTKGTLLPFLRELLKEARQYGTCGRNRFSNQEWDLTLPAGGAGGAGNQYGAEPPQYGNGPPQYGNGPPQYATGPAGPVDNWQSIPTGPAGPGGWPPINPAGPGGLPPINIQVQCNICDEFDNCYEDPSMCPPENDIAILILDSPVSYSDTIQPACMPPYGAQMPYGQTCVGVGWGYNTQLGDNSPFLSAINLVIQDPSNCPATQDQICTMALGGVGDVCSGDSGGPLLCKNSEDAWEVVAIVSNGSKCTALNGPGKWANVIYLQSWIDSIY